MPSHDMLTQAIANLEAVAAEMRCAPYSSVVKATVDCWTDKVLTAVSDLKEVDAAGWQPIETAPRDREVDFWIVPKTPEESYTDSSGTPITVAFTPRRKTCWYGGWSSLAKATHWMELPEPPSLQGSRS